MGYERDRRYDFVASESSFLFYDSSPFIYARKVLLVI